MSMNILPSRETICSCSNCATPGYTIIKKDRGADRFYDEYVKNPDVQIYELRVERGEHGNATISTYCTRCLAALAALASATVADQLGGK